MGHNVTQSDRLTRPAILNFKRLQVLINVSIKVKLALFHLLHNGNPGEKLGNGSRPEKRRFWVDRNPILNIKKTITLGEYHFAVFHDRNNTRGTVRAFHTVVYNTINEGFYNGWVCYIGGLEGIAWTVRQ
jgi:hypothetical protein